MSSSQETSTPTFAMLPPITKESAGNKGGKTKEDKASQANPPINLPRLKISNMNMNMNMNLNMNISDVTSKASNAIGNLFQAPNISLPSFATRKYTLPDRTTASQVLMFRQLLHTSCKPGLRLSRKFQGTPAQRTVMHMPVSIIICCDE